MKKLTGRPRLLIGALLGIAGAASVYGAAVGYAQLRRQAHQDFCADKLERVETFQACAGNLRCGFDVNDLLAARRAAGAYVQRCQ